MQVPYIQPATSINSPVIKVDIFRIGIVDAMVDSGAKNSVICEDLLSGRSCFLIRPSSSYRNIDGSAVGNVVGEVSISVRVGGSVLDLNRGVVVRSMISRLCWELNGLYKVAHLLRALMEELR